jgi:hypothetical protein
MSLIRGPGVSVHRRYQRTVERDQGWLIKLRLRSGLAGGVRVILPEAITAPLQTTEYQL